MQKDNTIIRLKRVLLSDKINMPNGLMALLKKDLMRVFDSYFDMNEDNLHIDIDSGADGYDISIRGQSQRIKSPKFLL